MRRIVAGLSAADPCHLRVLELEHARTEQRRRHTGRHEREHGTLGGLIVRRQPRRGRQLRPRPRSAGRRSCPAGSPRRPRATP